jgi:general secretion pathway protein L
MAEYVVIRLGRNPDQEVEWLVADDNGTRRGPLSAGTLGEAAAAVQNRPVIVLLPATETLTTTVDLPIRGARLNAALPYALEEQVAADVDTLHFAAGDKRESGVRPVAALARDTLDNWLVQLSEDGIQPWKLVPENYGLARIPGTMSILIDDDCVMFNDGADTEFVMQGVDPSDALVAAGHLIDRGDPDAPPEPSGHLVVYCNAADEERYAHDWIALRHELHSVDINLAAGKLRSESRLWLVVTSLAPGCNVASRPDNCRICIQGRGYLPADSGRNGAARPIRAGFSADSPW